LATDKSELETGLKNVKEELRKAKDDSALLKELEQVKATMNVRQAYYDSIKENQVVIRPCKHHETVEELQAANEKLRK